MKSRRALRHSICSLAICLLQLATSGLAGTQFTSHVTVNTPSRSFTHGVGDPLPTTAHRTRQRQLLRASYRSLNNRIPTQSERSGYQRVKPSIPFENEDRGGITQWQNNYFDVAIPLLPPSPYKVDSPDPESLWPEGLFLPPLSPPRFSSRRTDTDELIDPYLLQESEANTAVKKASLHDQLYFHDIPHIESLLANQELRIKNNLEPHRIGSIRRSWPYNRT